MRVAVKLPETPDVPPAYSQTKLLAKSTMSWPPAARLRLKPRPFVGISVLETVGGPAKPTCVKSVPVRPNQRESNSKRFSVSASAVR